jgi:hypothetical protein
LLLTNCAKSTKRQGSNRIIWIKRRSKQFTKSFPGAKRDWVEKFITSPYAFNEAINIAIVAATLYALR